MRAIFIRNLVAVLVLAILFTPPLLCQGPGGAPPSAPVEVGTVQEGVIAPQNVFIGTVEFPEVADVAAQVAGKVREVFFQEGDRVSAGDVLVRIDDETLAQELRAAKAQAASLGADLDHAVLEKNRTEKLFEKGTASEKAWDQARFGELSLRGKLDAQRAVVDRLSTDLSRTKIKAPFDGVVLAREVDRGEWLAPGKSVARVGRFHPMEARVYIPQSAAVFVRPGLGVEVTVNGKPLAGKVLAVVPEGSAATRSFPVRIRLDRDQDLMAGMEALVRLPTGPEEKTLVVPRDAVVSLFGALSVVGVVDGKAVPFPVSVLGYQGMSAGVAGQGLAKGMQVVVKGNERLRPGQPVSIANATPPPEKK
ncbi:MAG: efflux RND transporter periplasmic adaptor subunit [Thermodesulfobacteriota bacterium]